MPSAHRGTLPSRRTLITQGAAGLTLGAAFPAHAQTAPGTAATAPARVKGPPVWLDLDQKALDDAYDQSVYAPNQRDIQVRRDVSSRRDHETLKWRQLSRI